MKIEADPVKHPDHYQLGSLGIQAIDVIKVVSDRVDDGFEAYCRGNELKYLIRAEEKNGLEDLKKARVYLNWEIENAEKRGKEERNED